MKFILISLLFFFVVDHAYSNEVPIQDRIKTEKFFLNAYPDIFGKPEYGLRSKFKEVIGDLKKRDRKKVLKFIAKYEDHIAEKFLRPLVYWRFIAKNPERTGRVLTYSMLYKMMVVRDYIDNPLSKNKDKAVKLLKEMGKNPVLNSLNIYQQSFQDLNDKGQLIAAIDDPSAFERAIRETPLLIMQPHQKMRDLPTFSHSALGLIPGNKVTVISENDVSLARIEWLNQRVIFNGGKLDWEKDYMSMPSETNPNGHPVFKDPIFRQMRDLVLEAKESIFIDIFLFGGTMGATFTKFLIDQALLKKKDYPQFKVVILHDYATNYNMKEEMMPIFRYIKKRIDSEPEVKETVHLLQANIQRHPPGIPFGITNLIPKTDEVFAEIEKRNTYYESKIDHSKVIIIDGNSKNPKAYFGSKNWSDHSGAYYYDDVILVEGPAAALVQASYYRDLEAALTEDEAELKWFYYKEEGFDNVDYLDRKKYLLEWMDVKRNHYPIKGDTVVRIAEADVDGTIKNTRNILIDMISKAERNIYMEQLFIYDKYIVDALIKRKIQRPSLDIKILADHNGNFGLNGLPNSLFIKEMKDQNIEVRARVLHGVTANFPNGATQDYHQENHRKITSIDGKVILGGSSNLNPDTLQGSFREFGAQVYSVDQATAFEARFIKDWNDREKTHALDIVNFQAKVGGKLLSKEISALINAIGRTLFRAKDNLERRY